MGLCETQRKVNEGYFPDSPEPKQLELTNFSYLENYICKIKSNTIGTGFFCKINYYNKTIPVLMTNYHVINDKYLENNKSIKVTIKNVSYIIEIKKDSKIYSSTKDNYDIMIIKINKDNKDINNYLEIDPSIYKEDSLQTYENEIIYVLHYQNNSEKAYISEGKGIKQIGKYDIKHKCNTFHGSSGAPILSSLSKKVIGIHKGYLEAGSESFNVGTFLKFPLDELNQKLINNSKSKKNYIIAELYIPDGWINKDIRILNSYEEVTKKKIIGHNLKEEEYMNEKEINKCQIQINDENIPFTYCHKFRAKGNYTIKYSFMNYITKTNNMFFGCSSLTNINLSSFNSENVTNMSEMFLGCSSLINLDFSNFNTENVTNMGWVFSGCSSLKNLNLSNFKTQDVIIMNSMFEECSSLINIDLSNFNTEKVTEMICMFHRCSSLINIDLSNFNTENVNNMNGMFLGCSSLINIDLSNFNTEKVTSMYYMFGGCSSLKNIDLSNFRTHNVINMQGMFLGCSSLIDLDLSNFNTENVFNMHEMFSGCSSLKKINLSNFNTKNIFDMRCIFDGCFSLKKENIISKDIGSTLTFIGYH